MTTTIRNRMTIILLLVAILMVSITAAPAQAAAGGWTNLGGGNWVRHDASGTTVEVRAYNDSDPYVDVQIFVRSDGSVEWVGFDNYNGPAIDTWFYQYTSGAVYFFGDRDGNGTYETHAYDAANDGYFEWVRLDLNSDGDADTWVNLDSETDAILWVWADDVRPKGSQSEPMFHIWLATQPDYFPAW